MRIPLFGPTGRGVSERKTNGRNGGEERAGEADLRVEIDRVNNRCVEHVLPHYPHAHWFKSGVVRKRGKRGVSAERRTIRGTQFRPIRPLHPWKACKPRIRVGPLESDRGQRKKSEKTTTWRWVTAEDPHECCIGVDKWNIQGRETRSNCGASTHVAAPLSTRPPRRKWNTRELLPVPAAAHQRVKFAPIRRGRLVNDPTMTRTTVRKRVTWSGLVTMRTRLAKKGMLRKFSCSEPKTMRGGAAGHFGAVYKLDLETRPRNMSRRGRFFTDDKMCGRIAKVLDNASGYIVLGPLLGEYMCGEDDSVEDINLAGPHESAGGGGQREHRI
ncbi:hypothetical protein DFH09DRAFT_1108682 [Mycena vulgaris]|nr:hypothetical protein DFH09DRAFT_1108682 [Mycena vulgaris]